MQPQSDEPGSNQAAPQPGWQFTPNGGAQAPQQPAPQPPTEAPAPVQPQPQPQPQPTIPDPEPQPQPQPQPTIPDPEPQPQSSPTPSQSNVVPGESVSWSASEFVDHQKTSGWYGLLALAAVVAAVVVYLLTKDIISTVMVLIVMLALGIFAARKPRTLEYQVDTSGIHIGPKSYAYEEFKSFSVIDEGAMSSINLVPLKRFMPAISLYYDPQDEDHIVDVLSTYLPIEEGKKDAVDRFMHRIRF